MKSLIFIIVLVLPVIALSQNRTPESKLNTGESIRPSSAWPIEVRGGNAIRAMYEVKIDSTKEEYFELVIHTYSYRQVLRPFDDMALFTVDGLGKIFKLKNWTSRCVSSQVRSSIIVILNKKEFQSIGYAGTVGLKIGTNTFYMPYNTRHYIRQVGLQINSIQETKMMFYNPGSRGTVVKKISLESKVSNEQVSKSELRADTGKL